MTDYGKIRRLAKSRNLSLEEIASEIGMWRLYFNVLEKNNRNVPMDKLNVIAEKLNCNSEELMIFENE